MQLFKNIDLGTVSIHSSDLNITLEQEQGNIYGFSPIGNQIGLYSTKGQIVGLIGNLTSQMNFTNVSGSIKIQSPSQNYVGIQNIQNNAQVVTTGSQIIVQGNIDDYACANDQCTWINDLFTQNVEMLSQNCPQQLYNDSYYCLKPGYFNGTQIKYQGLFLQSTQQQSNFQIFQYYTNISNVLISGNQQFSYEQGYISNLFNNVSGTVNINNISVQQQLSSLVQVQISPLINQSTAILTITNCQINSTYRINGIYGTFVVYNDGNLTIQQSQISGTIETSQPAALFVYINSGPIKVINNQIDVQIYFTDPDEMSSGFIAYQNDGNLVMENNTGNIRGTYKECGCISGFCYQPEYCNVTVSEIILGLTGFPYQSSIQVNDEQIQFNYAFLDSININDSQVQIRSAGFQSNLNNVSLFNQRPQYNSILIYSNAIDLTGISNFAYLSYASNLSTVEIYDLQIQTLFQLDSNYNGLIAITNSTLNITEVSYQTIQMSTTYFYGVCKHIVSSNNFNIQQISLGGGINLTQSFAGVAQEIVNSTGTIQQINLLEDAYADGNIAGIAINVINTQMNVSQISINVSLIGQLNASGIINSVWQSTLYFNQITLQSGEIHGKQYLAGLVGTLQNTSSLQVTSAQISSLINGQETYKSASYVVFIESQSSYSLSSCTFTVNEWNRLYGSCPNAIFSQVQLASSGSYCPYFYRSGLSSPSITYTRTPTYWSPINNGQPYGLTWNQFVLYRPDDNIDFNDSFVSLDQSSTSDNSDGNPYSATTFRRDKIGRHFQNFKMWGTTRSKLRSTQNVGLNGITDMLMQEYSKAFFINVSSDRGYSIEAVTSGNCYLNRTYLTGFLERLLSNQSAYFINCFFKSQTFSGGSYSLYGKQEISGFVWNMEGSVYLYKCEYGSGTYYNTQAIVYQIGYNIPQNAYCRYYLQTNSISSITFQQNSQCVQEDWTLSQ